MDKKLYLPNDVELGLINKYCDLNKYLVVKTIESIILRGLRDENVGMMDNVDKEIGDCEDIYRSICMMYPNQVEKIPLARTDVNLCLKLLVSSDYDNSIYKLDNFAMFNTGDALIIYDVIDILSRKLLKNPKYRFEYKKNELFDDVFSVNFDYRGLGNEINSNKLLERLSYIDPIFIIKALLNGDLDEFSANEIKMLLKLSVSKYASRYGIDDLSNKISNKKLLKCIKIDENIIY